MASVEERLSVLEGLNRQNVDELNRWRSTVDAHMNSVNAKMAEAESKVRGLVQQFEQMSYKEKDGIKGLKKAFGAKGTDLKPE
eukprot:7243471-Karenia_brevis.AAC.1